MPVSRQTTDGLAREVADAYARAEVRLLRIIAKHLAADADAPDWVQRKLLQLQSVRRRIARELDVATREALDNLAGSLVTAYVRGQAAAQGDLDDAGVHTDVPPTQAERAVQALLADTTDQLTQLGNTVLRQVDDAYRAAVRTASSDTLVGAATRLQSAQSALDDLAGQGIGSFVDSAGRRWGLASYTEMATRSATARAAVNGHLERLADAGLHLVIVSDSPRECETCRPWEGKVLSTQAAVPAIAANAATGKSERVEVDATVAEATSRGLFHPNCTHSLRAYLPGVTERPKHTANAKGYAQRQQLRYLERKTREWKRRQAVAITPEAKAKADAKVRVWQSGIKQLTDANPTLIRQRQREQIGRAR